MVFPLERPPPLIANGGNILDQTAFLQWFDKIARHSRASWTPVTVTAAYSVAAEVSWVRANCTGGAFAVTLPPSGNYGRWIGIIKTDSSANAATVTAAGSDTINGSATVSLSAQYDLIVVRDMGSSWDIMFSNQLAKMSGTLAVASGGTGATTASGARTNLGLGPQAANMAPITNSISGNVSLSNTANYFDGPSIAQGTSGTWFASGTITVYDPGAATFSVKLWDGTTVISSTRTDSPTAGAATAISISGFISSPAGNIRISVKDELSVNGLILANNSGNSKDSTVTAIRVG